MANHNQRRIRFYGSLDVLQKALCSKSGKENTMNQGDSLIPEYSAKVWRC